MSVQSRSLTGGAAGLIEYYGLDLEMELQPHLGAYYAETSVPRSGAPDADDAVVFRGAQVSGRAALHMGIALEQEAPHLVEADRTDRQGRPA